MAPKSQAAKSRRGNKKQKKGGKAGCQGNFHGMREAFILEKFPAYLGVKGTARSLQNKFWNGFFSEWFDRFQWNLPLDQDPDPSFPPPPEETPEILAQKAQIIKLTKARLKAHMRYRASAAARKEHNPWEDIIASILNDLDESPPPRKLPLWQFYMSKKRDEIAAEVDIRWSDANLPDKELVAFRGRIARELLEKEPQEYRDELQEECDKAHELDEQEYEAAETVKASLSNDEATREKARQNFSLISQPLLELLRRYTGFYIAMIAGVPLPEGEKEFELKSLSAGKASGGRTWHGVEGTHFQQEVMPSFTRFLLETPEYQERLQNVGGDASQSPSPPIPSTAMSTAPTTTSTSSGPAGSGAKRTRSVTSKKRKGPGRARADESDSASETESSDSDSDEEAGTKKAWEVGDDEDEDDAGEGEGESEGDGDGEGEGEGEDETGVNSEVRSTIPDNAEVFTADDLGLNDAMKRKLEGMPENERQVWLWVHRNISEYDLQCFNTRAQNDEILASLGVDSNFLSKKQPQKRVQPKPKKKLASSQQPATTTSQPSTVARRSARLNQTIDSAHPNGEDSNSSHANPGSTTSVPETPCTTNSGIPTTGSTTPGAAKPSCGSSVSASSSSTNPGSTNSGSATLGSATLGSATLGSATLGSATPGSATPGSTTPGSANPGSTTPGSVNSGTGSATDSMCVDVENVSVENTGPMTQTSTSTIGENLKEVGPKSWNTTTDKEGWPSWVSEGFEFFFKSQSYGGEFARAVLNWTRLEREYGFETSNKGLPAKHRPDAVAHWIRVGRRVLDKTPPMPSEDAYSSSWWDWWASLQPEWRTRDSSGRPVVGGEGAWNELRYPGKNGMLIVLLSLWWWRGIATTTLDDWNIAVHDVCWVLEKMAATAESGSPVTLKRSANEQGGPASGKRARR